MTDHRTDGRTDDADGEQSQQSEDPEDWTPEVGEVVSLDGLSWEPWLLVLEVDDRALDEALDPQPCVRWALLDNPDDDAIAPVPDDDHLLIEESVGDRAARREAARTIDERLDVDDYWCPVDRVSALGSPGIQDCPPPETASDDAKPGGSAS